MARLQEDEKWVEHGHTFEWDPAKFWTACDSANQWPEQSKRWNKIQTLIKFAKSTFTILDKKIKITTCTITQISDHWQSCWPKLQQYRSHYTSRKSLIRYWAQIQAIDLCTCRSIQNLIFSLRRTKVRRSTKRKP